MGWVRFTLSMLVLYSHLGWMFLGINPGVVAVVIFYLLAGYVVEQLLHAGRNTSTPLATFYRDRLWRVMPAYLTALALAAGLWLSSTIESPFVATTPSGWALLGNISIIPLNYYMYSGIDSFTLIPPAWSLGAEVQFYLLAPLLFRLPHTLLLGIFGISICLFITAQTGWLHTDHFGYRLLPGILFVFIAGILTARMITSPESAVQKNTRRLFLALWSSCVAYFVFLIINEIHRPHDREVALGLIIAIGVILVRSKQGNPGKREPTWSRRLGNYAYGIFLFHFPALWMIETIVPDTNLFVLVPLLTLVLAAITYHLLEQPLWRLFRPDMRSHIKATPRTYTHEIAMLSARR
ncbi:acyltransferase [Marinobacterium sp. AK62]|uniref:Acyltransferase n=1 Tax=Marinobacterium alkalitolerans TaxID=1542925 RepID=A0ABS3ZDE7_9GAMM|nr:acyltransferase [Marinobacterium alkalitolerans]MBP0049722.1 acyltransferase [Marinobacterium alkalitolerans]